jgi:hypothetical protein
MERFFLLLFFIIIIAVLLTVVDWIKEQLGIGQSSTKSDNFDLGKAAFGSGKKGSTSNNEISNGFGEFGMVKTNPIPLNGVFALYTYLPELRYPYTSKTGFVTYLPVQFERTMDSDNTPIGASLSDFSGAAGGTSAPNIGDNIDVYNLYDQSGFKLAKIYLHGYQSYTSAKAPEGFVLASDISDEQDAVKVIDKLENLSEDEKEKLGQDVIDKMSKES